uniref:ABC transmembrane type-1 domain-containing protein n=1 Tax=Globisporangium ultimum (strain ATCC 200006 / CBS 805.95 / DAOM BR144) TaxID=431595 RepID=K3WIN8_GLOUD
MSCRQQCELRGMIGQLNNRRRQGQSVRQASLCLRMREIREREIAVIRKYDYLRANNMVVLSLAQTFMVAMCFFVYVYQGNTIDVPTAFTLLAFANVCRMPFGIFSNAVVFASEAIASMQRISKFLAADEIEINLNQDLRKAMCANAHL